MQKLEKGGKQILLQSLQKECNPANTLALARWDAFWTFGFRNSKMDGKFVLF